MNIFISWSKASSLEYAIKLKELLNNLDAGLNVFVSEQDISAGESVQTVIIDKITQSDKLILCFTRDNKKSPWLLFEAGYAKGLNKSVIPVLFDPDDNWHSWVDNPMNTAREISLCHDTFVDVFIQALQIKNTKNNRNKIAVFKGEIESIKEKNKLVDSQCEDFVNKLLRAGSFVLENPYFHDKQVRFFAGFESYDLYKAIIESFLYTGKYLWIYGRKNMKLFGGNFNSFFQYLHDKSYDNAAMNGIDFKCLFLSPNSPEVSHAHKQQNIFKNELCSTLQRAKEIIGNNKYLEQCFKLYSNKREEVIIRVDNTIIYSRPMFDANGTPQLLTGTQFEVFAANSKRGKECIEKFMDVWNNAQDMHYDF